MIDAKDFKDLARILERLATQAERDAQAEPPPSFQRGWLTGKANAYRSIASQIHVLLAQAKESEQ